MKICGRNSSSVVAMRKTRDASVYASTTPTYYQHTTNRDQNYRGKHSSPTCKRCYKANQARLRNIPPMDKSRIQSGERLERGKSMGESQSFWLHDNTTRRSSYLRYGGQKYLVCSRRSGRIAQTLTGTRHQEIQHHHRHASQPPAVTKLDFGRG